MVDIDTPVIITHSDISAFLRCRRAWQYDYVLDYRPPEKLTGALALGTRVHAALEAYYKEETSDPIEWIQKKGEADLEELDRRPDTKPWDYTSMYEDMIVGRNCLTAYMDWLAETNADANYRVISTEEKVEVPILGGKAILRGKVDLLWEDVSNGFVCTNDFKTSGDNDAAGLRGQLEKSYQHWCYLIAAQHAYPDRIVECAQYTILRKVKKIPTTSKTPLITRFSVPSTRRSLRSKLAQIERIATEMIHLRSQSDQSVFYPSPGQACKWCDYKAPCEIADESVEGSLALLSNGKYTQGMRYSRYNLEEDNHGA